MIAAGARDEERLRQGFLLVTARRPSEQEQQEIFNLLRAEREEFSGAPERARALVAIGESPLPVGVEVAELAAWTLIGNLLLNLDEVLCRE